MVIWRSARSARGPLTGHLRPRPERDITTNPEWERLYQYEIPVLAKVLADGTELRNEILPRLSPRLTVELIQKKVSSVFDHFAFRAAAVRVAIGGMMIAVIVLGYKQPRTCL
uniref:Glutaredoxin-like protein n=1 Tax=Aegilops tauschii TaxID=37682 RepID=M8C1M3_AEGTA